MGFFTLAEIKKAGLSLSKNALSSSFSSEHLAAVELGHRFLAGSNPQRCSAGILEPELASGIWYQLLAGVDLLSQTAGLRLRDNLIALRLGNDGVILSFGCWD